MTAQRNRLIATASLILLPSALLMPADLWADDVSDALDTATAAYQAGDLKTTSDQIGRANKALYGLKSALLAQYLPPAPDGWTRDISADFAAALDISGGGAGAEASYTKGDTSFVVRITMDNPLVAAMSEMYSNPETMAMLGTVVRAGEMDLVDQGEGGLMGMVDRRVMVSALGASADVIVPILDAMDFSVLATFDQP